MPVSVKQLRDNQNNFIYPKIAKEGLVEPIYGSDVVISAINGIQSSTVQGALNELAGNNVEIVKTASGSVISVSDSADYRLLGLRIYGKSGQATTTGAQLLDIREEIASYGTSITATTDGTGGVTINGTAGGGGQADIYLVGSWDSSEVLFEEDTYTFSVDGLSADESLYVINNQSAVKQSIGTGSCTVTSQITGLCIRLKAGKTYSNLKIYPMLSASSSAKPWEPYTGGKPSPSPEYPQEIESAGDSGNITVTLSDGGDKVQTLTYPTPNGLPGIPVDSGGNYTDVDGQQWICDEVDFGRGKYVQRVKKEELTGTPNFNVTSDIDAERFWWGSCLTNTYKDGSNSSLSTFASYQRWSTGTSNHPIFAVSEKGVYFKPTASTTADEVNALFTQMIASENPPYILGQLETPVETDLTPEQLTAYAALTTYKPNTTVTTDSSPAVGLEVKYLTDSGVAEVLGYYATQSWVQEQGYLTAVPAEYVTDTELTAKGYATTADVAEAYAKKALKFTGTFKAAGWAQETAVGPPGGTSVRYSQTINVSGLTADDEPIIDLNSTATDADTFNEQLEAFGLVSNFTTGAGTLTAVVLGDSAPEVDIPIHGVVVY